VTIILRLVNMIRHNNTTTRKEHHHWGTYPNHPTDLCKRHLRRYGRMPGSPQLAGSPTRFLSSRTCKHPSIHNTHHHYHNSVKCSDRRPNSRARRKRKSLAADTRTKLEYLWASCYQGDT